MARACRSCSLMPRFNSPSFISFVVTCAGKGEKKVHCFCFAIVIACCMSSYCASSTHRYSIPSNLIRKHCVKHSFLHVPLHSSIPSILTEHAKEKKPPHIPTTLASASHKISLATFSPSPQPTNGPFPHTTREGRVKKLQDTNKEKTLLYQLNQAMSNYWHREKIRHNRGKQERIEMKDEDALTNKTLKKTKGNKRKGTPEMQ